MKPEKIKRTDHGRKMKKALKVGDKVTTNKARRAYYEDFMFEPGMVGVVAHLDVPAVYYGHFSGDVFICVDFDNPNTGKVNPASSFGYVYSQSRCALDYNEIVLLSE